MEPFRHGEQRRGIYAYHVWFYGSGVPFRLTWEGVPTLKSPLDMWNYQQIIWDLRPSLVIELGTNRGGAALFFSRVLEALGDDRCVLTFDVEQAQVDDRLMQRPNVVFCRASTTSREAADTISAMRRRYPGSVFVILDSDHTKEHVLEELRLITPLLATGDRVVVEDTNINGRPVLPGWGPGPFEAVEAFLLEPPTPTRETSKPNRSSAGLSRQEDSSFACEERLGSRHSAFGSHLDHGRLDKSCSSPTPTHTASVTR